MLPALKSEFRKLFTVRSTYVITAFIALFIVFFAGYIQGFKADSATLQDSGYLAAQSAGALAFAGVFCGLISILLLSHEYRYNTIMYTLTSVNSRSKVLLSKILAMTAFAVGIAIIMALWSPLVAYLGIQLAGNDLAAQTVPLGDLIWRGLFFMWAYSMIGLVLVALTRNQIFSVVALFFIPITVEGIAALLLKENAIYLPFTSLMAVITDNPNIAPPKAALVFLGYLASSWATAWFLFLRRDAN